MTRKMTVGELIDVLRRYPQDVEVKVTWEGTVHELTPDLIYIRNGTDVMSDEDMEKNFVFINGDDGADQGAGKSL